MVVVEVLSSSSGSIVVMPPAFNRGDGALSDVLYPSVHPFISSYICVCPMPIAQQQCILGWLLQNTNKKPHAGKQTQWSVTGVAKTARKLSPALLQNHMQGDCIIIMPNRTTINGEHIV